MFLMFQIFQNIGLMGCWKQRIQRFLDKLPGSQGLLVKGLELWGCICSLGKIGQLGNTLPWPGVENKRVENKGIWSSFHKFPWWRQRIRRFLAKIPDSQGLVRKSPELWKYICSLFTWESWEATCFRHSKHTVFIRAGEQGHIYIYMQLFFVLCPSQG